MSTLDELQVFFDESDELLAPYGEWSGLASVYLLTGYARGFVPLPLAA